MTEDRLRISVTPEPTEDELAAIIVAVKHALAQKQDQGNTELKGQGKWREAAKRDALRDTSWEKSSW